MERLSFFPTPYPDECFYSIFARYYVRSGISAPRRAARVFFGFDSSVLVSTVFLPRRLERMDQWVDPACGLTSKELICRRRQSSFIMYYNFPSLSGSREKEIQP